MPSDFNRDVSAIPTSNLLADNVYRVNPADREQGRATRDQFRDTLQKKKQNRSDTPAECSDDDDAPSENTSALTSPVPADRVLISSTPLTEPPALEATASEVPAKENNVQNDDPPPTGRINITA